MSEVQERFRLFFFSRGGPVFAPSSTFFLFFGSFSSLYSVSSSSFLFFLPTFSFTSVLCEVADGWFPAFLNKLVKNVGFGLEGTSALVSGEDESKIQI